MIKNIQLVHTFFSSFFSLISLKNTASAIGDLHMFPAKYFKIYLLLQTSRRFWSNNWLSFSLEDKTVINIFNQASYYTDQCKASTTKSLIVKRLSPSPNNCCRFHHWKPWSAEG